MADAYAERVKKNGYVGSAIDCPECGGSAGFHAYRDKALDTYDGTVICQRAYYYCRGCGQGSCPWDQRVGLQDHRLSPPLERVTALCGAVADSFEKGADLLKKTAGLRLCESTVERTMIAVGERIAKHLQKGRTFGGQQSWDWYRDPRPECGLPQHRRQWRAATREARPAG